MRSVEEKFEGQEKIPVPPFWGGLRIVPTVIEFWVYICFFLVNFIPWFLAPLILFKVNVRENMGNAEYTPHLYTHMEYHACLLDWMSMANFSLCTIARATEQTPR